MTRATPNHSVDPAENFSPRIAKFLINGLALFCGAAVMALEMVGVRLLEPYLGSTIYVWGAIIGIFLGSLAIGYYGGGNFAERSPRLSSPAMLIAFAAIWIFAIPFAVRPLGEWAITAFSDPRWQALFAALILYAVPSALLGMVSPFLVRLSARDVKNIGQTAGGIYAIGTCGSIVGTFLVSFVLTEYVGSVWITWGIGAVLLLTALVAAAAAKFLPRLKFFGLAIVAILIGGGGAFSAKVAVGDRTTHSGFPRHSAAASYRERERGINLASRESAYHLINVFDGQFDFSEREFLTGENSARYMVFNDQLESGCLLTNGEPREPVETACGYVKLLTLGTVITGESPKRIAMIGAGGGVGALMFRDMYPQISRLDVADIDPIVFELAGKFFNYPYSREIGKPDSPDSEAEIIRSHVIDGRNFLRAADDNFYDYIVLDAYTAGGRIPKHLISREFFMLAQRKLSAGGVVVANVISAVDDHKRGRLLPAVMKTASSVFRHVYLFPRDLTAPGNMIIVCSDDGGEKMTASEIRRNFSRLAAQKIAREDTRYTVENYLSAEISVASAPLLTDDFCPTDSMTAR